MFKKLLKHDFRSLKNTFGKPALVALAIATVISILCVLYINYGDTESTAGDILFIISCIMLGFSALAAIVVVAGAQIMVYVDFYKNLLTDEGYLTFTLPVKAKQIIFSKITNGAIWAIITSAATFVAVFIVAVIAMIPHVNPSPNLPSEETVISAFGVINAILGILVGIASYFATQLLYFVVIFFGATSFKGDKPTKIILCIFGANFAISTITSIVATIVEIVTMNMVITNYEAITTLILGIYTVLLSALAVGMYFLLKYLMEKKLNLP